MLRQHAQCWRGAIGLNIADDGLSGFSLSDNTAYHTVDFPLSIDNTDIDFVGSIVVNDDSTTSFPGSDIIQIGLFNITPIPVLN